MSGTTYLIPVYDRTQKHEHQRTFNDDKTVRDRTQLSTENYDHGSHDYLANIHLSRHGYRRENIVLSKKLGS